MSDFEWNNSFELGHTEIDAHHRQLFLLGEAVVAPMMDPSAKLPGLVPLQAFIEFAHEHFAFEETVMHSCGYPEANHHSRIHAALLVELITYSNKVQHGQRADPAAMIGFLKDWLQLHIDSADREFVTWLKSVNCT